MLLDLNYLCIQRKEQIYHWLGYYEHVINLPINFFGTRKVGEIVSRFNDATKIREAISGATLSIMIDTLMAIQLVQLLYLYKIVFYLEGTGFYLINSTNKGTEKETFFAWFASIDHLETEGRIVVEIGQRLKELLVEMKKRIYLLHKKF